MTMLADFDPLNPTWAMTTPAHLVVSDGLVTVTEGQSPEMVTLCSEMVELALRRQQILAEIDQRNYMIKHLKAYFGVRATVQREVCEVMAEGRWHVAGFEVCGEEDAQGNLVGVRVLFVVPTEEGEMIVTSLAREIILGESVDLRSWGDLVEEMGQVCLLIEQCEQCEQEHEAIHRQLVALIAKTEKNGVDYLARFVLPGEQVVRLIPHVHDNRHATVCAMSVTGRERMAKLTQEIAAPAPVIHAEIQGETMEAVGNLATRAPEMAIAISDAPIMVDPKKRNAPIPDPNAPKDSAAEEAKGPQEQPRETPAEEARPDEPGHSD